jgi:hypothetical protein
MRLFLHPHLLLALGARARIRNAATRSTLLFWRSYNQIHGLKMFKAMVCTSPPVLTVSIQSPLGAP